MGFRDWFEEKIAVRADNLPKNRTFEEKTGLGGETGNGCVGSRLVCDHASEDADISLKYDARSESENLPAVKIHKKRACNRVADPVKQP